MPNKPTTLREEFAKAFNLEIIVDEPRQNKYYSMKGNEIADWWLEKLTSHNTELISKIEERIKGIAVLHRDIVLRSQMNDQEAVKYYPSSAKNALLIPLDEVLEVISIINQDKYDN